MTQEPKIFPYIARLLQGAEVVWKTLGEVAEIKTGQSVSKNIIAENAGDYPVINSGREPLGFINTWNTDNDPIGITSRGAGVGSVTWQEGKYFRGNLNYSVSIHDSSILDTRFLYYLLLQMQIDIQALCTFQGIPALNAANLKKLSIPLPPLSVQQEIVRILDKFTQLEAELEAELDCRKRQYEYYRNNLLSYEGNEVEWKTLDQISENLDSKRQPITSGLRTSGKVPYYGASGIVDYVEDYIFDGDFLLISEDGANLLARNTPIAFSVSGKIWVNNHAHILKFRTYEERRFIEFYLNKTDLTPYISGAAQPKLNKKNLNSIKIPIPPLEEQQRIATILDKFDTLVNSISEGLPKEIALRRKQYEYYREKLLSFPKE